MRWLLRSGGGGPSSADNMRLEGWSHYKYSLSTALQTMVTVVRIESYGAQESVGARYAKCMFHCLQAEFGCDLTHSRPIYKKRGLPHCACSLLILDIPVKGRICLMAIVAKPIHQWPTSITKERHGIQAR
jgi:hypothetical protein